MTSKCDKENFQCFTVIIYKTIMVWHLWCSGLIQLRRDTWEHFSIQSNTSSEWVIWKSVKLLRHLTAARIANVVVSTFHTHIYVCRILLNCWYIIRRCANDYTTSSNAHCHETCDTCLLLAKIKVKTYQKKRKSW